MMKTLISIREKRIEKPSTTNNITKYPVGTRVPRNEKADRIFGQVLFQYNKSKKSI